jgi:hypothetical protein
MAKDLSKARWHICRKCDRRVYESNPDPCDCDPDHPSKMEPVQAEKPVPPASADRPQAPKIS